MNVREMREMNFRRLCWSSLFLVRGMGDDGCRGAVQAKECDRKLCPQGYPCGKPRFERQSGVMSTPGGTVPRQFPTDLRRSASMRSTGQWPYGVSVLTTNLGTLRLSFKAPASVARS